jgi:hypothetical protein
MNNGMDQETSLVPRIVGLLETDVQPTFDDPYLEAMQDGRTERLFRRLAKNEDTKTIEALFRVLVERGDGQMVPEEDVSRWMDESSIQMDQNDIDLTIDLYVSLVRAQLVFQRFFGERLDDNPLVLHQEYTIFDVYLSCESMDILSAWLLWYVLTLRYRLRVYARFLEPIDNHPIARRLRHQRIDLSRNLVLCESTSIPDGDVLQRAIVQGSGIALLDLTGQATIQSRHLHGVPVAHFVLAGDRFWEVSDNIEIEQWAKGIEPE